MSNSAITGPVLSDNKRAPAGTAAAPSFAFNDSTGTGVYLVSPGVLGLSTNGVQRVVVTAAGNVGIGTSTPHPVGADWKALTVGVSGIQGPAFGTSGANLHHNSYYNGSSWVRATTGGTAHMEFDTTGFKFYSDSSGSPGNFTPTERMRLDASGNLLVGTTSAPTTAWNSFSKNHFAFGLQLTSPANGNYWRQISWSGSAVDSTLYFPGGTALNAVANVASLTSAGAWSSASDGRQKTNVKDLENGIEKVLQTKPRRYNRIDVEGEFVGFVAQELKEVVPEVVHGSDETSYSVSYGELVAVAFKAIQEQQAQIEALKAEVAALKAP